MKPQLATLQILVVRNGTNFRAKKRFSYQYGHENSYEIVRKSVQYCTEIRTKSYEN